jgi:hypothetical protein
MERSDPRFPLTYLEGIESLDIRLPIKKIHRGTLKQVVRVRP